VCLSDSYRQRFPIHCPDSLISSPFRYLSTPPSSLSPSYSLRPVLPNASLIISFPSRTTFSNPRSTNSLQHSCVVNAHLCGEPCKQSGKLGCLEDCTKVAVTTISGYKDSSTFRLPGMRKMSTYALRLNICVVKYDIKAAVLCLLR
jgi:hypothetical protein